jgi:hypothetical protein
VAKYIHPNDKWIALRKKMPEASLQEVGLDRAKMADFLRKVLPDYTAEHQSKYVVEQDSETPLEMPVPVKPKRESRDDDDDCDAESIDLRELATTPRFRDRQYGVRKKAISL